MRGTKSGSYCTFKSLKIFKTFEILKLQNRQNATLHSPFRRCTKLKMENFFRQDNLHKLPIISNYLSRNETTFCI